jgi:hypothetical protein
MGSSSLLDIIGSFIVGGILLLMGLSLNASSNEVRAVYSGNYNLQANLTTLVEMLQTDFRKLGYCRVWQNMTNPIQLAQANRISFRADLNNNGTVNTITYYTGPTSELNDTPNPNDFYLYRKVDAAAATRMNFGTTQFSLKYRDANDDSLSFPITDPRVVYYLEVTVAVSTPAPYTQEYSPDSSKYQVYWKQMRLVSKNLTNR